MIRFGKTDQAGGSPIIADKKAPQELGGDRPVQEISGSKDQYTKVSGNHGAVQNAEHTSADCAVIVELLSAPLPDRRLPPLNEAMAAPSIREISPSELYPVPKEIVERLDHAKKVLVIGHVPPDGDCVGSAIGLARMMRALGKEAHACIDDHMPGNLRKMDDHDDFAVRRACKLDDDYDLVVFVDVAAANRIGAAAEVVARAKDVMVIDHHLVEASHESLGMLPDARLTKWIESGADSASLLIASAMAALREAHPERVLSKEEWHHIMLPLAVGAFTDTDGFARPGATMEALQGYKYLVHHALGGDAGAVRGVLDYHLPRTAARLLSGALRSNRGIRGELAVQLGELMKKNVRVGMEAERDRTTALMTAPKELMEFALEVAKRDDPDTSMNDVRGYLLHMLDQLPRTFKLAVLLFEEADGVLVSTRSQDPGPALALAREIAQTLGGSGDGHLHMAGAKPPKSLDETAAMVREWFGDWRLAREAKLRAAGNM